MSKIDTGGAAFPLVIPNSEAWSEFDRGMTLRDWFAGQALMTLSSSDLHKVLITKKTNATLGENNGTKAGITARIIASISYHIADAMIAEKRRTEGGAA